jgi:hypothetical protein
VVRKQLQIEGGCRADPDYNPSETIDNDYRKVRSMTSEKQAQANRRNALKSTGPKTPEGKTAVRHNARKHGLLSTDILLPGEDEAALMELGERLRDELQPVGELENLLVDRIISSTWRLQRLGRVEAGIFAFELSEVRAIRSDSDIDTAMLGLSFIRDGNSANAFSKLSRYETTLERSLFKALHELQRLQATRGAGGNVSPPVAVDVNVSGISREAL